MSFSCSHTRFRFYQLENKKEEDNEKKRQKIDEYSISTPSRCFLVRFVSRCVFLLLGPLHPVLNSKFKRSNEPSTDVKGIWRRSITYLGFADSKSYRRNQWLWRFLGSENIPWFFDVWANWNFPCSQRSQLGPIPEVQFRRLFEWKQSRDLAAPCKCMFQQGRRLRSLICSGKH